MGGFLLKRLFEERAEIVAVVRDSVPRSLAVQEGLLQQVTTVHGTIEDIDFLRRTFAEYSIETVLHLAAQPLVGVAKLDPLTTLEVNVRGTWNVLEAARLCGVKQVVVASSDKAYGASPDLPYLETHPLQGRYPYDVSKSCADLIATMYAETYKLPVAIARCANLFGAGDLNFSRVIPGAIQATLDGRPFVIRSDGKFVRDFLYVKDAADAYMTLAQSLASDRTLTGEAFNFGLGIRLTVAELVGRILDLMDRRDLVPVILNQASVEIREQFLSSDKSAARLGWSPRYSLEEGLRETVEWYKLHFAGQARAAQAAGFAGSR
jgi:CDP-glucose 4,6-dehydratase